MKKLSDYLNESAFAAENPVTGDVFAINIREECLVESVVLEHDVDGIVIAADEKMLEIFESYGITVEDVCMECGLTECECSHVHEDNIEYAEEEPQPNPGEYDEEGDMAKTELHTMIRAARKLIGMLDDEANMPEWTQKKINKAADYVDTAADYIASQKERGVMEQGDDHEELANEVYAEFERMYPNLARRADERTIHSAIIDVLNYGSDSDPGALAQDVARAVKRNMQGVAESYPKHQDLSGISTEKLKAYLAKQSQQAVSGEGNQVKRVRAELQRRQQGVAEDSQETSPVARAVLHRIMMAHPGVLAQHGPERVMSAVDELADRVNIGPDDEIGSSDVSGWVRDVIRMLSELPDEPMNVSDALDEAEKKGLYYNVNKRKQAGTSRDKDHPKAPTAQAWKDAAKTAKTEGYEIDEAEYQGRKVQLNKPSANTDGASKSKVYVKDPQTGNVKKVTFGDPDMKIRKSNPGARKSFRARHKCDNPGPKTKARYWACRSW